MNQRFVYIGCFIDYQKFHDAIDGIRKNPPERAIENPHVTFAYKPQEVDRALFGEEIQIKIVGYGNDGANEGVKVVATSANPVLQAMIDRLEVPHITIAVSREGESVNTKNLSFEAVEPIELVGKFGGYTKRKGVITQEPL